MISQRYSQAKPTLSQLQEQFRQLCTTGMRGADAIANFREDPKGNLGVVRDCTAEMKGRLVELKQDLEKAKVALASGEKIFYWEFAALEKIASNAEIPFEEIQQKIEVQNGSVVELDLSFTPTADLGPVAYLTSLKTLHVYHSQVSDISPLVSVTALEKLDLESTKVSVLTPLIKLTALKKLDLSDTPASNNLASQKIIAELRARGARVYK